MPRAGRVCSRSGCPNLTTNGRCDSCNRDADRARGTASQRGYTSRGHLAFRTAVLDRDPICVLCQIRVATVADHWPISRRELDDAGQDPNNPERGRGLCKPCHDRETVQNQPGGWHQQP